MGFEGREKLIKLSSCPNGVEGRLGKALKNAGCK
jgi:hypothetical protein